MKILYKYKKIIYLSATLLLAFISMYAIVALRNMQGETWCATNQIIYSFTIQTAFIGIVNGILIWKYFNIDDSRIKIISLVFGMITGFLYVIGWMLQYENNISENVLPITLAIVSLPAGIFANALNYCVKHYNSQKINEFFISKEEKYSTWKIIVFYNILFFISFIPAFLAYYPAQLVYDAYYQFSYIYNGYMTTHHPVIHMLLIKLAYNVGTAISSGNKGFALISLLQMFTLSFSFAYGIGFLRKIGVSRKIRIIVAVILIIFPINAVYSVSVTKDVFFAAFFLLHVIETLNMYMKENLTKKSVIFYVTITVFMILFRNNALYAFFVSIPFIVAVMRGKRKKVLAMMILSMILSVGINRELQILQGAYDNSSIKEILSLPIQQVARVYAYKEEAREDMQDILEYIPDNLLMSYNPYISDNVKYDIDNRLLRQNIVSFIKTWVTMGLRYPAEYVEAFLTNTMGYWYMDDTAHARIYGAGGYMLVEYSPENFYGVVEPKCYFGLAREYYDSLFLENGYQNIPLISIMFRPAFYFMGYLVGLMTIVYLKKYKLLVPYIPVVCYFLTVLLAPVALVRYVYCLIVAMVFIVVWGIRIALK